MAALPCSVFSSRIDPSSTRRQATPGISCRGAVSFPRLSCGLRTCAPHAGRVLERSPESEAAALPKGAWQLILCPHPLATVLPGSRGGGCEQRICTRPQQGHRQVSERLPCLSMYVTLRDFSYFLPLSSGLCFSLPLSWVLGQNRHRQRL